MQKWEYMTFFIGSGDTVSVINGKTESVLDSITGRKRVPLIDFLTKIGEDGWEVVASYRNHTLVAKRPKS